VAGMRLAAGDQVVACALVRDGAQLVTVSERGYGKRTALSEFPTQRRGAAPGRRARCSW